MYMVFVYSAVLKELPVLCLVARNKTIPSLLAVLILACNVYLISLGIPEAF